LQDLGLGRASSFIILHPGSGGSSRDWPASRFADLAGALAGTATVVVTGGAPEAALIEQVVAGSGGRARACIGRFSLMEFAAFMSKAKLFISNSTGPLHIAAAVGTPVIGIYPPLATASVIRWGPLGERVATFTPDRRKCPQCHGGICSGNVCMEQISVESVAEAAKELIG
ncbi:MAG: glycosyltransferase family 9 protein, partial [Bacteroidota bacterium]